MKRTRKVMSILLAVLLLMQASAVMPARAEENPDDFTAETTFSVQEETEEGEIEWPEELIVANTTNTKGDFFTEMFGNNTSDIDVRALIHGYNLVNWDRNQGVYVFDPSVVTSVTKRADDEGNHIYYLVLAEDLEYSDGTPITAWDYAFSLLLMMSPEMEQIGAKIYRAEHLFGYKEYISGRNKAIRGEPVPFSEKSLTGVDVIDDYQLMITLDHEFLPYFFETGLLLCVPYPIHVIAPGCRVYDDGFGVYIGNEDSSVEKPLYTAELLQKTVLDPETGYNSHPSVVSGPYVITGWDGKTAHFEINEHYKGMWYHNTLPNVEPEIYAAGKMVPLTDNNGNQLKDDYGNFSFLIKPTIEKIAFTEAKNETMIEQLSAGELHLINKTVHGETIQHGMDEAGVNDFTFQNYLRVGLAFLTFTYDWPTVHEQEVRQAMAWCMDRDGLTQKYCTTFGQRVDGYYGIEQWEYQLLQHQISYPITLVDENYISGQNPAYDEMIENSEYRFTRSDEEYEAAVAAWDELNLDNLTTYTVDLDRANDLLDRAEWTLNREGEPYRPGVDEVRCKMIDGNLVPLDLTMMYPEGNRMAEYMQEEGMFIDNLAQVGIKLTPVSAPMQDLLYSYYRETERTTDMIYLATNFHVVVDPSITYSTDNTKEHQIWNNTYSDDEELYNRAVDMRKTEPYDFYNYVRKWILFQERYNEVLPTIPVYSNVYFDFLTNKLQNYYISGQATWSQAIVLSYFGLPVEAEDDEMVDSQEVEYEEIEEIRQTNRKQIGEKPEIGD